MKRSANGFRLLAMLMIVTCAAFGQGTLKGVVSDTLDRSPLIGANVFLVGTGFGAASNLQGEYSIPKIPIGTYQVRVSLLGYRTKFFDVRVLNGETAVLNVPLSVEAIAGDTVFITAQLAGQIAAINKQLMSNTITNVVSADKILELPDANAAESVGRLPGVSILRSGGEGNKVVIRGLSPTYNAITIAGDRIPATDLDDRSVDLSMIAPEILAGIEVTKALTPDKDADAFGGTVDFQLTSAPRGGFKYSARLQDSYNRERHEYGEYKGRITMSHRFFDERFGLLITGNAEKTQRGSDQFNASYAVAREKRPDEEFAPITTNSVDFQHSFDVRKRLGFSLMADYEIPGGKLVTNNFLSRLDRDQVTRIKRYDMSGSNKMKYYLRDRQTQIDVLSNSLGGEHDITFLKINWKLSRSASTTRYPFNSRFQFQEMSAFNTSAIPAIASPEDLINNAFNRTENAFLYDGEYEPERSFERDLSAQVNLEWPFTISSTIVGKLKGGGKLREKSRERDRSYAANRLDKTDPNYGTFHSLYGTPGFTYDRMPGTGYAYMKYYVDPGFDSGDYLDGKYNFGIGLSQGELNNLLKGYLFDRVYKYSLQRDMDDYKLVDNLSAGYIMTEINLGRLIMLLPGVRYELTNIDATGKVGTVNSLDDEGFLDDQRVQDTTATIRYSRWFPMVHLRIRPADWFDIRLAYTNAISYPRMDYIIPAKKIKASEVTVVYGRPDLKPQLSTNYDAYLSVYANKVGLLTAGAFYKKIDNLIYLRTGHIILDPVKEGVENNLRGYYITQPENNPLKTTLYGFEFEWQTNFKWLPSPFDGIVINANYSHIWSETRFPRSFVKQERIPVFPYLLTTVIDTFRVGKMPDQASDIANFSFGYDLGKFSGRVSMLLQGKTLSFVGVREELDGFTDDYIRWDMSLKYDLWQTFGIFANVNNITNEPDESHMQTARYATGREFYGWTADLGFSWKF